MGATVRVGCGDKDQCNPGFGNIIGCYHFIYEIEVIIRSEKGCILLLLLIRRYNFSIVHRRSILKERNGFPGTYN